MIPGQLSPKYISNEKPKQTPISFVSIETHHQISRQCFLKTMYIHKTTNVQQYQQQFNVEYNRHVYSHIATC